MALTLSRCMPRLLGRSALRPLRQARAIPVMAFKEENKEVREKSDLAKPQKEKAVAKVPSELSLSAHPIRWVSMGGLGNTFLSHHGSRGCHERSQSRGTLHADLQQPSPCTAVSWQACVAWCLMPSSATDTSVCGPLART